MVNLSPSARVALACLSLCLSGLLFMPNLRTFQAHRLQRAAEEHQLWGRLGAAQASLERALELTPLDAALYRKLGDLGRVRLRWRSGAAVQDETVAAYATATALNPLDGELFADYAEALLGAQRYEAAHRALTEAFRRDPNNANFHTLRGRLAEAEGDLTGALNAYRHAETIKPSRERQAHIEVLEARGN